MAMFPKRAVKVLNKRKALIAQGDVRPIPYQSHSTAATIAALKEDFNKFLDKLCAAGYMKNFYLFPEPSDQTILGESVSDLQTDISVCEDPTGNGIITGTLKYVEGFTGFSGDPEFQDGNFIALHFDAPDYTKLKFAKFQGGVMGDFKPLDSDMNCVVRVTNKDTFILVFAIFDSEGAEVERFCYSLAGLTCEEPEAEAEGD